MSAGILSQVSFKKETNWGEAVTPDKTIPVHAKGGIQTNNANGKITAIKGVLAKVIDTFIGARVHEGEYEMDLSPDYAAYLVLSAMGAVTSGAKASESIVYTHAITQAETKPSLTIEQVVGENVRRYAGAVATGFKISSKVGEAVTLGVGFKAKSQATAIKISPAVTTVRPFNFADASFKIGGVAITEVVSFDIEYKNGVTLEHALNGSNDPSFVGISAPEISGKIDCFLDATTLAEYNAYLAKTEKAIDIVFTGAAIGNASFNGLTISVPRVVYSVSETPLNDGLNHVTIEWEGNWDAVTSKLLAATFTNLLANLS